MILNVHPVQPSQRHIGIIGDTLRRGGLIIYPTDTVYALGADMYNAYAVERLCQLIGKRAEEANLSLICYDLSSLSQYTVPFDNRVFRVMKKALPGPYTFILQANNKVPKIFKNKKREIGIRVPDNNIARSIVYELGHPMVSASIHNGYADSYYVDPLDLADEYGKRVDLVIDGGPGSHEVSTVVNCTHDDIEVIREGKGDLAVI